MGDNNTRGPSALLKWSLAMGMLLLGVVHSFLVEAATANGNSYNTATLVLTAELCKLAFSLTFWVLVDGRSIGDKFNIKIALAYGAPALCYAFSNSFALLSVKYLGAARASLLANGKFVLTAVIHRLLLKVPKSFLQWCSLLLLTAAMVVCQMKGMVEGNGNGDKDATSRPLSVPSSKGGDSNSSFFFRLNDVQKGVMYILFAGLFSAFSGVVSELLVKNVNKRAPLSFQNLLLYTWGVFFNLWGVHMGESSGSSSSFLERAYSGFNVYVWSALGTLVVQGLTISAIMKYLDNIVKCFAFAGTVFLSVILQSTVDSYLLDRYFLSGLAMYAVGLYGYFLPPGKEKSVEPRGESQIVRHFV
uniref:EamA domain-containing protein n=1 Tax=Chromera velia CCMP2878 TaxID=1169474 RepID=A0A0G4EZ32_9ALVE|eukprot:Cvel_14277.t1-p1 / transcript=Cvel_14277.t1 / gene=Cvel_14277 / organism=Chromera_velia_CCMP2878 / gene_product=Probable UDP-sugar transporter protein SLC35A4, putative / transcript_product=Probable UDP-sugar transporter protein SLC35A4, putative / location=Cvel_scaffold1008:3857-5279(+) / protein_length=359 / sequence_SO=supercontig / SO=protein_coding / is_pseudo=false